MSHILPAPALTVGIEQQHVDGRAFQDFQDELVIQWARCDLELGPATQSAGPELELHLAGVGNQDALFKRRSLLPAPSHAIISRQRPRGLEIGSAQPSAGIRTILPFQLQSKGF